MEVFDFRSFHPGDEQSIVDLFWQAGPHIRTVGFWRWTNQGNPFGVSIVELMESNGVIVGHYAIMPVVLSAGGRQVKAGFAIQAVIHPSFRNLKNLMCLTDRVWERCAQEGIELIYAFPNNNIWKVYLTLMDMRAICDFRSLELPFRDHPVELPRLKSPVKVERLASFNHDFDDLWAVSPIAITKKIAISRSTEFLNWRFFQNPLEHYIVYAATVNGEVRGYIVLKFYRVGDKFYGHIVDILTSNEGLLNVCRALLKAAFEFFSRSRVDVVSGWMCPNNPYNDILSSLGFASTGFITHFGYKPIREEIPQGLPEFENWYLTMADSDAF